MYIQQIKYMKTINSKDNKVFKKLIKLQQKKQRDKEAEYLIEGENLVIDSARKKVVNLIVFSENYYKTKGTAKFDELLESDFDYIVLNEKLFASVSDTETPQGVIGVSKKKRYSVEQFFSDRNNKIVVLDRVQDPGNVGTIIRTAKATKHKLIIIKGTADPYSPKVVRSAMSGISDIPILFIDNVEELENLLHNRKIILVGGDAKGDMSYKEIGEYKDIAIVVGNEGNGISKEMITLLDRKVSIPMEESIESLNVAIAAGLMMYESYTNENA